MNNSHLKLIVPCSLAGVSLAHPPAKAGPHGPDRQGMHPPPRPVNSCRDGCSAFARTDAPVALTPAMTTCPPANPHTCRHARQAPASSRIPRKQPADSKTSKQPV